MVFPKGRLRTIRQLHKVCKVKNYKVKNLCAYPAPSRNSPFLVAHVHVLSINYVLFAEDSQINLYLELFICFIIKPYFQHDPCPEIVKYGTTIFTINCGIEGGIYVVVDGLGHTPRRHDGEEELEVHVEEAHEMDGDDSEDGDDTDDICGWKEQKAYYLGNNYMVAAVAGSNTWFKPIIQNRTRRVFLSFFS